MAHNYAKSNIIILGATSAIAKGSCKALIEQGATLYLASRDVDELERLAADLNIRYSTAQNIYTAYFDAEDFSAHANFFNQALNILGKIDGVLLAFGYLGDPNLYWDFSEQKRILDRNLLGATSILSYFADYFAQKKAGFIIGVSSVAGIEACGKIIATTRLKVDYQLIYRGCVIDFTSKIFASLRLSLGS